MPLIVSFRGLDENAARAMLLGADMDAWGGAWSETGGRSEAPLLSQSGPATREPFLFLTDPTLGKPWGALIEEAVLRDMALKQRAASVVSSKHRRTSFSDRPIDSTEYRATTANSTSGALSSPRHPAGSVVELDDIRLASSFSNRKPSPSMTAHSIDVLTEEVQPAELLW